MGPANSAQVHFSSQQLRAEQKTKKKKKRKTQNKYANATIIRIQMGTKCGTLKQFL